MFESNVDRRSFLRGSALFAAAVGLTVVAPVSAQEQEQEKKPEEKKDPFANSENKKSGDKALIDEDGREYRICPQCAYNMYKQGRMWVCENCGYSYVE